MDAIIDTIVFILGLVVAGAFILYMAVPFKKLLSMRNLGPPFGMTEEEFTANRRKQKLLLVLSLMLLVMISGAATLFVGGASLIDVVPERSMEELMKVHGIFFYEMSGGRVSTHIFRLRDEKTGKVILTINTKLCGNVNSLELDALQPANIWIPKKLDTYPFIYQLEVNGRMECDLDTANARTRIINNGVYFRGLWVFNAFLLMLSPMVRFRVESYVKNVYGKDFG